MFWQGKKAENAVFLFLTSGFAVFICLWYCQIQTTGLIIFFKGSRNFFFLLMAGPLRGWGEGPAIKEVPMVIKL